MNPSDTLESLQDQLAIRAGIMTADARNVHPGAQRFAEQNVLTALAEAYGAMSPRKGSGPTAAFVAGMGSDEFVEALAGMARRVILARLTSISEHRLICTTRYNPNFMDHNFPVVDSDPILEEISEGREIPGEVSVTTMEGLVARVRVFAKNIFITRQLIKNDDIGLIFSFLGNVGAAAARLEAKLVFDLIESNPLLGDQMVMFHADHGNLGPIEQLSITSLGAGTAALRNMPLPSGEKANLPARFIVVSPEHELRTKHVLKDSDESIQVIAAPWISSANWYLVSDPEIAPTVSLLYLKGSTRGVVVGRPRQSAAQKMRDGIALGIRFDVGVVPVGRIGIYKGRIG